MTKNELYHILKTASVDEKYDSFNNIDSSLLDQNVFNLLVTQLHDKDERTRFFALFYLIDKFSKRLSNANDELADLMIQLLKDPNSPIANRAKWALNIMGDVGLKKLFENVNSGDSNFKWGVLVTIGKSAHLNVKKSIEVLVEAIQDKNEDVRYAAVETLMGLSPLPRENNDTITDFDFKPIYELIKPVAKSFSNSKKEMRRDSGIRYIKWIEEEEIKRNNR